ncbi:hypothetical protein ParaKuw1_00036 [Paracoccus phage ParKuw1]|uniref:Uncharacterized protein n=1 Tax=Paracoccus phage ParKuw1 TaxID=3032415 RepID=A0AAF0JHZ6_9CAUD|nr:hypothetical protein ParaKuw1_00036 [Paracoccus phage ParKuw1]
MFQRDQKEISDYAMTGPDQMARVITFVYLTIQQSITTCEDMMRDVDRQGVESRHLWGFKIGAYEWLHEHKQEVYDMARLLHDGYADPAVAEIETLKFFASLPGLGLVKGGFVNQLIFGQTGCMDTHNSVIFEIDPYRFKASRYKSASMKRKAIMVMDYANICWDQGGPEFLWDNWCSYVAERNGYTADAISAMHCKALGL